MNSAKPGTATGQQATGQHWIAQHSKPVIFLILTLALTGAFLAFTIPVSVFPATNFPRVLIAVDNGVMPIDQMMVTVTRPIGHHRSGFVGPNITAPGAPAAAAIRGRPDSPGPRRMPGPASLAVAGAPSAQGAPTAARTEAVSR